MKATGVLLASGLALLFGVLFLGIYVVPRAQSGSPKTARQSDAARVPVSDVYLDITYATPQFVKRVKLEPYLERYQGRAQPFLIGINTHVGSIEHLDLRGKVELEDRHGDRYPSLGAPVVVSEHHNLYLVVFPLLDNHGQPIFAADRDRFRLRVHGVGKTAERVFEWKLPVIEPAPARTLANALMLALGVVGALMVILSPCAIELTTYYTGIIAGVVSSAAQAERVLEMGSAGDPPAPVGDSPTKKPAANCWKRPSFLARSATALPSGESPDGTGGSPVVPNVDSSNTRATKPLSAPVRRRILANLAGFVAGFTLLYMTSGAMVAVLGRSLLSGDGAVAKQIQPLIEAICGPNPNAQLPARFQTAAAKVAPVAREDHSGHAGLFGEWGHWAKLLGASFLVFFALKALGLFKSSAACFVWLGKLGRATRAGLAGLVAVVSPKRAEVIRRPCLSLRQPGNITPLNSFCAGLGLSVSCLTCMGGAILYPLLIFIGTATWYWGALILGTYSLALAVPMAAIAVSVGDFAWKYPHRPWLTRGLQWTSAVVMIFVATLIAFDHTRFINTVVFTVLNAVGGSPDPTLAKL